MKTKDDEMFSETLISDSECIFTYYPGFLGDFERTHEKKFKKFIGEHRYF